jgi:hypothetical protein
VCQVEEVNVGLHVAGSEQLDTERFRGDFFFQLEVALVSKVVAASRLVVCGACLIGCRLAGVLVEYILLGARDELVLLLDFCLLCNLSDPGVRIEYGLQFHI